MSLLPILLLYKQLHEFFDSLLQVRCCSVSGEQAMKKILLAVDNTKGSERAAQPTKDRTHRRDSTFAGS